MFVYHFQKIDINPTKLLGEITSVISEPSHINTYENNVLIHFSSELDSSQITILTNTVKNHKSRSSDELIRIMYTSAVRFGDTLMDEFIQENIKLGITQRGLTNHVRKTLREVKDALETGSLYDALNEIKNLDIKDFDSTILSEIRILEMKNKIEDFLNLPRTNNWRN